MAPNTHVFSAPSTFERPRSSNRSACFVRNPNESLTNIDVPTVDGIYLGMDDRRGGYLAYVPQWNKHSRPVYVLGHGHSVREKD